MKLVWYGPSLSRYLIISHYLFILYDIAHCHAGAFILKAQRDVEDPPDKNKPWDQTTSADTRYEGAMVINLLNA
jgi:hypothetical protein